MSEMGNIIQNWIDGRVGKSECHYPEEKWWQNIQIMFEVLN